MHNVEIVRLESTLEYGTFGVLKVQKEVFCVTLEPPNFDNMQDMSCIPAGQYVCSNIRSPKYGITYGVRHVPNRENIIFHSGNTVEHTEGCILLAQYYGKLRGDRAALNSGNTFRNFLGIMRPYNSFLLTITEAY